MSVLIYLLHGPLAQLGERQVRNLEVRGSIPLRSTTGKPATKVAGFPVVELRLGEKPRFEHKDPAPRQQRLPQAAPAVRRGIRSVTEGRSPGVSP